MQNTLAAIALLALALAGLPTPVAALQVAAPAEAPQRVELSSAAIVEASAPAVATLRTELTRTMTVPGWRGESWGVLVVSLDHGDTLFARNPDAALAPASNMKLFTSAAALYYLGPDFRYSTFLLADGEIRDGVLDGELIVYGTGDPTLESRDAEIWHAFADSVAALGVRRITGAVVGDASYFEGPGSGAGWRTSYVNASFAAPASGLVLDDNLVTVVVRPGPAPGAPAVVETVPGRDGVAVTNVATTTAGAQARLQIGRSGYDSPIVVSGTIGVGHAGTTRVVPVGDGGNFVAAVLRQALAERGIEVAGGVRQVTDPTGSRISRRSIFAPTFDGETRLRLLAVHQSAPLVEILSVVNKQSHNLYAENVVRTVGRVVLGEGSAEAGARAVRYFLECELGAEGLVLEMVDGSGLSPLNRVSAGSLVRLLGYMAESTWWDAFWSTLPEAGRADGLRRMYGTRAAGNLRAKTGTINNVSALSGYVRTRDGERLVFSIVSNDVPSTWRAKVVEDQIGARLATFARPVSAPAAVVAD